MSFKKWIAVFFCCLGAFSAVMAGFNIAVDPFGVFGDRFLDYYAYDMTQNPRIAKIAYLEKNYEKYDSYIIGSSKTSSYSVDKLNEYMNASFYNMIMYGGDLYDAQKTAEYVIDHYNVKNIILNIGVEEAVQYEQEDDPIKGNLHAKVDGRSQLLFYLKYAFLNPQYAFDKLKAYGERDYLPTANEVFIPETGAYNKAIRDVENVGMPKIKDGSNPEFFLYRERRDDLMNMDKAAEAVGAVKEKCRERGINFMLIASPMFDTELADYDYEQLCTYWQKLADVTDFYDFSGYTDVSMDSRYFYDDAHFRNCVGDMALAYIFSDSAVYVPENFGHITTAENAYEHAREAFLRPDTVKTDYYKDVPVLMYHNLSTEPSDNAMTITVDLFEEHLKALRDNGYTTITLTELEDYVKKGTELPQKPVVITFDDGYTSNYDYAFGLLEKYGAKATIFCVGATMGMDIYKDTGKKMNPHFNYEQAREMYGSGNVMIQSHTFDLHRNKELDAQYRNGASKLEGETDAEFAEIFKSDMLKSKQDIEENVGNELFALAYPQGVHSTLTDACVPEVGIDITFTVNEAPNVVVKGIPQTLYNLNRIGIYQETTPEALIERIEINTLYK
ncbi:MAG: polysaccharide deacetylase family protein [Clostridiales bacterium]|nr:polysaccharide deacetylase family protein [Clostridiales bacterium]